MEMQLAFTMKGSKGSRLYLFWNPKDPNFEIACNGKKGYFQESSM